MSHAIARFQHFLRENDFSQDKLLERVNVEIEGTLTLVSNKYDSEYVAMPAYVLLGLGLNYIGSNRHALTKEQHSALDAALTELGEAVGTPYRLLDDKYNHWELARLYAKPLLDLFRIFAQMLPHPGLINHIWIWEGAIIDTAAWFLQADPDLHPTMLFGNCIDIHAFIVSADHVNVFKAIGALHATLDPLTNQWYRNKLKHPLPKKKRSTRLDRLIHRRDLALQGGPDHELLPFFDLAIRAAGAKHPVQGPAN
ncbi:hypothetical protein EMQ25_11735 [Arsenicitalea aurantiaca]|uniref:Uncharacterized protein n=1 Tax=Arsenicitalea aurantiaca TaxID=1783274 RepID=A0A433X7H6_9HYPH|nr:hypothetical protein [Arsenicitalea aurantiaca]RUT30000.1 hypothetical protein EMQ25_11735 [Arsenicitalea aurantiaca]